VPLTKKTVLFNLPMTTSSLKSFYVLIIASATVLASLLGRGTNVTYFVRASVMHKINFLPLSAVFKGPKRSAWTRWLGSVGCGKDNSKVGGG
jgi:hypothetical protein